MISQQHEDLRDQVVTAHGINKDKLKHDMEYEANKSARLSHRKLSVK